MLFSHLSRPMAGETLRGKPQARLSFLLAARVENEPALTARPLAGREGLVTFRPTLRQVEVLPFERTFLSVAFEALISG